VTLLSRQVPREVPSSCHVVPGKATWSKVLTAFAATHGESVDVIASAHLGWTTIN